MSLVGEAVENRGADLPGRSASPAPWGARPAADGLRKSDSMRSAGNAGQPVSSGDGPPQAKRARRDAVTRVWEWLDVSVSREASLTLGGADFGHMHLSEGSSVTTAVTAAPPCDAVEPCVSSLPDNQTLGEVSEGILLQPGMGSLGTTANIDRSQLRSSTGVQGPDEASSKRHDAVGSPTQLAGSSVRFDLEARGSSTPGAPVAFQTPGDTAPAGPGAAGAAPAAEGTPAELRRVTRQNSRKRKHDRDCDEGGSCEGHTADAFPLRPEEPGRSKDQAGGAVAAATGNL